MRTPRFPRIGALAVALFLLCAAPLVAGAQGAAARRFEITAVGDTTFTFAVGDARWVKPHLRGTAVDPRRRDVLVARFEIVSVRDGEAMALVTGATTRISTDHVAQLSEPRPSWWRTAGVWVAAGLGLAAGLAIGAASS